MGRHPGRRGDTDAVGAVVVDVEDVQAPAAVQVQDVSLGGDAREAGGDQAGHGLVRAVRCLQAYRGELVEADRAVRLPCSAP